MAVSAVATTFPAGAPCPYVNVALAGLSGSTYTVYRAWGGMRAIVRGMKRIPFVGATFSFADYEAPFGTPVTYAVEVYNSSSVVIDSVTSADVTLTVTAVWIQDPVSPSISCTVTLEGLALSHIEYRREGVLSAISGSGTPVLSSSVRRVGSGIPLSILCDDEAEAVAALGVLLVTDPALVRTPAGYQLPRLAYFTADSIIREFPGGVVVMNGESDLILTGDLVAAPSASILVPTRTYADVASAHSTYAAVASAWPTYLALLRG